MGERETMTKLEPILCAFDCDNHGGHPVIPLETGGYQVFCNACNARGPVEYSEEQAIKAWNRRTLRSVEPAPNKDKL